MSAPEQQPVQNFKPEELSKLLEQELASKKAQMATLSDQVVGLEESIAKLKA